MRIQNNIMALNAHRQYTINNTNIAKSIEKLSSGYRINRAGDDAAGLAISEKMRAQIRGLNMASKNSQDAISLVQTAEGALQTSHDILQRMRELAVQSASDSNETTIDRAALEKEFQALLKEIDDTATKTRFNDQNIIDGTFQKVLTSKSLTGIAGNADATYAKNTDLGSYTFTVTRTAATTTTGIDPTTTRVPEGDITALISGGAVGKITVDFTDTNAISVPAEDGVNDLTVANVNYDAPSNQLTMELTSGDGNTYYAAVNLALDANGKTTAQTVNIDIGDFATMTFDVLAGYDGADVAAAITAATGTAAIIGDTAAGIAEWDPNAGKVAWVTGYTQASWSDGSVTGDQVDGPYDFGIDSTTNGLDQVEFSLTNGLTGEVVFALVDLEQYLADPTGLSAGDSLGGIENLVIDFGDGYGQLQITVDLSSIVADGANNIDAVSLSDFQTALDATWSVAGSREIVFNNGYNGDTITINLPNSGTVSLNGGTAVDLKEGMTEYSDPFTYDTFGNVTGGTGVALKFDKALVAADFASAQALYNAVFGGTGSNTTGVGVLNISAKDGKDFIVQTGANQGDELAINIDAMDAWTLGIDSASIAVRESAANAITLVNNAINAVSMQRADLGALQNRLEFKIQNLDISAENLQAAESRIRDLDMAKEMTNFTKQNILAQAATAMLAQANALPQGVLQLLK